MTVRSASMVRSIFLLLAAGGLAACEPGMQPQSAVASAALESELCDARAGEALRGHIQLNSAIDAERGYDFSEKAHRSVTGGDFYFYDNAFIANNVGQRGVISVGACAGIESVATFPAAGYRYSVPAVVGDCYVSLTENDERGHIVFRVEWLYDTRVGLSYTVVPMQLTPLTLNTASDAQRGYDFSAKQYTSYTGGDFYIAGNALIGNNIGQRGSLTVGPCDDPNDIVIPTSGYTIGAVPLKVGECYVTRTHNLERDHIVMRVTGINGAVVNLDYAVIPGNLTPLTLNSSLDAQRGYDFSAKQYTSYTGGDFYVSSNALIGNNIGQRGSLSVGACNDPNDVVIPDTGYFIGAVPLNVGECYVTRTHNLERDHIVMRVTNIVGSVIDVDYVIVKSGLTALTLNSSLDAQRGYDFSAKQYTSYTGGDFYVSSNALIGNNIGQRGSLSVGACDDPNDVVIPDTGYFIGAVPLNVGECYVTRTHNLERDHIVMRVTSIAGSVIDVDYVIKRGNLTGLVLNSSLDAQRGYDFSAKQYTSYTGGDFYVSSNALIGNNIGQRGSVSVGLCDDPNDVAIPSTGYFIGAVPLKVGECYVTRTHNLERGHVVMRVTNIAGSVIDVDYVLVPGPNLSALTLDDSLDAQRGYDFSERRYTSYTGGDFYLSGDALIGNNAGQSGSISVGPCSDATDIVIPTSGYTIGSVPLRAGECYVTRSEQPECDYVLFRVAAVRGNAYDIEWLFASDRPAPRCNDGIGCTTDTWNTTTQSCQYTPDHAACDDGAYCNGDETCSATADCQPGVQVGCDDGNPCTGDWCSDSAGCSHYYTTGACEDGNACTGGDTCSIGSCVPGSLNLCPPDGDLFFDDFAAGLQRWTESGDGDWNTESLHATTGYTGSGAPAAHSDDCDGECRIELATALDLTPYASATLQFSRFVDSELDSGEYLRVEAWNGAAWVRLFSWTNGAGDDNRWHAESVDLSAYLSVASFRVRFLTKSSLTSEHVHVDDVRIAVAGAGPECTVNTDCDDGNACSNDSCAGGSCVHSNNSAACDDGDACTGGDQCSGGACVAGATDLCPEPVEIFIDRFTNLSSWTERGEGDWNTESLHASTGYPTGASGSPAAHSDNCDSECTLELTTAINLTQYQGAELQLLRFVDSYVATGEYLRVELWNGSAWTRAFEWGGGNGDDNRWHQETLDLAGYLSVSSFRIRLVTKSASSYAHVHVDDLRIVAQ